MPFFLYKSAHIPVTQYHCQGEPLPTDLEHPHQPSVSSFLVSPEMVQFTQKHILFHNTPTWGHQKPIIPFSMQILRSRPNVVISVLTCADVYSKLSAEVDKLPDELREDAKVRFHIIDISGVIFNPLPPVLEFEPTFKAIFNGETIKCLSSGKEYNLPPVTVALIDPFAGYAIEAIREISENKTPYLLWFTGTAGVGLQYFRQTPSEKLNMHTIRYGREQDIMPRLPEFLDSVTGETITCPGVATMYDYEKYPQELPIVGDMFIHLGRKYIASGQGMIIVSSSSFEREAIDATKKWFSSLGQVVYPVGPSLLPDTPSSAPLTSARCDAQVPVVEFLDRMQKKHGERSVVYMSFGTFFWPKNPEKVWAVIEELLATGTPLIWAHPSPFCVVPEDKLKLFQDSDIAFEMQWAPQKEILSHPVTGWFISHGGWNSAQEAMYYGIPQIYWPIGADQPLNAANMTLVKKAGFELIEVRTGEYGTRKMYRFKDSDPKDLPTFTVEAVRREIRELVTKLKGEEGLAVRKSFEKISREFLSGWNEGGEARESMDTFLKSKSRDASPVDGNNPRPFQNRPALLMSNSRTHGTRINNTMEHIRSQSIVNAIWHQTLPRPSIIVVLAVSWNSFESRGFGFISRIGGFGIRSTAGSTMSTSAPGKRVIVIGGGLAGASAAHTLLEHGSAVILLDKKPSLGGNSVKASSGINGAGTETQKAHGIEDSVEAFTKDTTASAGDDLARPHLIHALTSNSAPALSWLTSQFGVDLTLVTRLGGHSIPRTHRGKGGAPGWAITSALIKKLEQAENGTVMKNAKVTKILQEEGSSGRVVGVEYEVNGEKKVDHGSVVVATGGYGADFAGFLTQYKPDVVSLPTTNGDHATGDGHRLVQNLTGAKKGVLCDMDQIQVHPTGFVDPSNRDAKTKFLAAEALRGVGGLLIDRAGKRFVNELDRRDAVTTAMQQCIDDGKGPVRMVLNVQAYETLKAHCDFYISKGLMKKYPSAKEFTDDTGLSLDALNDTFTAHSGFAAGKAKDPFGKTNFDNADYNVNDTLFIAEMTPVVHYTMGGITVDGGAHVLDADGQKIPGLYAAGEVIGGVHGRNRLGGSSLLEAVVFGRLAGENAAKDS
ncbi:hypothetical protein D9758_013333 [Tetrapyrgos nigripes]|uniref:fumarate reductase (NADH) n=1 Tax=Tetrapyrgos nigripes TaxID=182062 RepID=A0A8H5CCF6_9AGAR|nr:hypothetical protein D9758_013333 [Tetrapyrgos nigripes]